MRHLSYLKTVVSLSKCSDRYQLLCHHLKKAPASFRGVSVGHIAWTFLREGLEGQERGRSTHLRKMISEAPLLYMR